MYRLFFLIVIVILSIEADAPVLKLVKKFGDKKRRYFSLDISPDGRRLIISDDNNHLSIYDIKTTEKVIDLEYDNAIVGYGYGVFAAGSYQYDCTVFNETTKEALFKVDWLDTTSIAFEGKYMIVGDCYGVVRIWNFITGEMIHQFDMTGEIISSIVFNPINRTIFAAGSEEIYLYDVNEEKSILTISLSMTFANAVTFSPDGRFLAAGLSYPGCLIKIWDISNGKCVMILKGHEESVFGVAFSPDGKYLVSGSHDWTIRLWDVETGECLSSSEEESDITAPFKFTPDWKYLVTSNEKGKIKLWSLQY